MSLLSLLLLSLLFICCDAFVLQDPLPRTGSLFRLSASTSDLLEAMNQGRAQGLSHVHRYRGAVDQGYGRGGKQLGVPTANLPASLFQQALETVTAGVYFGWAALEDESNSSSSIHKAVVNVGYSPTFEGQENQEKIIEAHLMLPPSSSLLPDFYGVPLRLQLLGFLREEQKFDSFPELVAQINADVEDARNLLDASPYSEMKQDPFLAVATKAPWIGSGGGDATASWEFQPMSDALEIVL